MTARPGRHLAGGAVLMLVLAGCSSRDPVAVDLVDRYPAAEKRSTLALTQAFSVFDTTIDGIRRRTILAHAPARLTWTVDVPRHARLRTWVALRPDAWTRAGDGVVFRIGAASGDRYEVLAHVHVDPYGRPADRRWVPLEVTLENYGGRSAKLIFSTDAGPVEGIGDVRSDLALWGDPQILTGAERQ